MSKRGRPKHPDILTPREWEVLGHLRNGLTNEEIAERLAVTIDGVKYHVSEILSKLDVDNRHDAARWAEQEQPRPWWAGALAPLFFWRRLKLGWLSPAIGGGLLLMIAAGIGLLIWGLVATRGGDGEETVHSPVVPATTAVEILNQPSPNFGAVDFVSDEEGWMTAGGGLLHTLDGGENWDEIARVTGNDVDFVDAMHGWLVGSSGAIYRSDDGGQTWSAQDSGTEIHLSDIEVIDASEAWVVGSGRGFSDNISFPLPTVLLHTIDGGITWQGIDTPDGAWYQKVTFVGAHGWVAGTFGSASGALLYTRDGGASWDMLDAELPPFGTSIVFPTESHGWMSTRCFTSKTPCEEGLMETLDGGLTWKELPVTGYGNLRGPVFRDERQGWLLARDETQPCCVQVVLQTHDGGATWEPRAELDGFWIELEFLDAERGFASADRILYETGDGGETWNRVFPKEDDDIDLGFVQDVAFSDDKHGWIITERTAYVTEDGARSWEEREFDNPRQRFREVQVIDQDVAWAVVYIDEGPSPPPRQLVRTTDGARSWSVVREIGTDGHNLAAVSRDVAWYASRNCVPLPCRSTVFKTSDGGETWSESDPGEASVISMVFADEQNGWISGWQCAEECTNKLLRTEDGGITWHEVSLGQPVWGDLILLDAATGWLQPLEFGFQVTNTTVGGRTLLYQLR